MSAAQFPAELLEQIVPHLADNPAALSTCCLSSRVFVPACRIVRFQSITLDDQRKDSSRFNALLEASPPSAVAIYVRCLRVMDPHRFGYEKGRDAIALARILNYFRTFPIHLQIFSKHRPGISWSHIRWLQDAISELSSIQSFGTEDRFTTFPTNTSWPAYGDVAALGLFSFPYDFKKTTETLGRLRLSAFRLSDIGSRSIQMYLNNALLKWLDLSGLRALAFCTKIGETPDTTGAWLSALIQRCSATLEYLVFEPRDPPNDLELPLRGCPRLKRVSIIVTFETKIDWDNLLLPWANIFLEQCPSLRTGEITFSLMANRPVPPWTEPIDPGRLLIGIEELKERFPTCSLIFSHPYNTLVLEKGSFPPSLVIESRCTYVKFWSWFYLT